MKEQSGTGGNTCSSLAAKVKPVDCGIPEAALDKWVGQCLSCLYDNGRKRRYRFTFEGSTCMNGGDPFTAQMQILVEETEKGVVVSDALIFFTEDQREAASRMCAYRERGEEFFRELQAPPPFRGKIIEEVLTEPVALNPAGCFCTEEMVAHKWRLALATVHRALLREAAGAEDGKGRDA